MARPNEVLIKDPNDELIYEVDWSEWLGDDEIVSSTFTISTAPDAELTKDNPGIVTGNQKTVVRLLGGTVGKQYRITNQITTDESPTEKVERSFYVRIKNL